MITKPAKGGALNLVPTGAGEARKLTHDDVSYAAVTFFPDGKRLLALGIEPGHGGRDYIIDVNSGDSKPVTPEGVGGIELSPDGKKRGSARARREARDVDAGGGGLQPENLHPLAAIGPRDAIIGWTPDGQSLYVVPDRRGAAALRTAKVNRFNIQSGKMEPWKTFGEETGAGVTVVAPPDLSSDGTAYAYLYVRILSEAYVVKGLN